MHIGIGAFARAHLAWYTAHAPDAGDWAISGFTGRSPDLAERLGPQNGLYTLIERGPSGSTYEVLTAVDEVVALQIAREHMEQLVLRNPLLLHEIGRTIKERGDEARRALGV